MNPSRYYFEPISDRIESEKLSENILFAHRAVDVMSGVLGNEQILLITESFSPHNLGETKTGVVEKLAFEVKRQNQKSKIILYAVDFWNINESLFDFSIQAKNEKSYELLFKKIKEFIN